MADEDLTGRIIGAAIEVHKRLGPGLLESTYEACLCIELMRSGISFEKQKMLPIEYRGERVENGYRIDLLVEDSVVVELKAVREIDDVHLAQILSYLKLSGLKTGLLINFNVLKLIDGVKRVSN